MVHGTWFYKILFREKKQNSLVTALIKREMKNVGEVNGFFFECLLKYQNSIMYLVCCKSAVQEIIFTCNWSLDLNRK